MTIKVILGRSSAATLFDDALRQNRRRKADAQEGHERSAGQTEPPNTAPALEN
jgi:hypothetical protein